MAPLPSSAAQWFKVMSFKCIAQWGFSKFQFGAVGCHTWACPASGPKSPWAMPFPKASTSGQHLVSTGWCTSQGGGGSIVATERTSQLTMSPRHCAAASLSLSRSHCQGQAWCCLVNDILLGRLGSSGVPPNVVRPLRRLGVEVSCLEIVAPPALACRGSGPRSTACIRLQAKSQHQLLVCKTVHTPLLDRE